MSIRICRPARLVLCGLVLLANGCTSLREIPRGEYAAQPERRDVRIHTRDGLVYEFDYARVQGDSLIGFRRREVEGSFDEFGTARVALDDVDQLSSRGVDWYRTGLVGGGVLLAVIVGGLSAAGRGGNGEPSSGGGKIPPAIAHPAR